MKKAIQALSLALTLSLFGGAAMADEGTFKLSDYGDGFRTPSNHCWRGFAFQVGKNVAVTSLIFSIGDDDDRGIWQAAVYSAEVGVGNDEGSYANLSGLLGYVESTEVGQEMSAELEEPVTLETNQWYVIAQGRVTGGDEHVRVRDFDSTNILSSQDLITAWGNVETNLVFSWGCGDTAEEILLNSSQGGTTSTIPGLGFVYSDAAAKVDSLFAQDARFNQLAAGCRRDFAQDVQALTAPTLNRYESCLFYDVTKSNISRVNSDALASYKASVTAGKTMTEAEIIAMVQNLALRYNTIDRLINNPESVYATDLVNIGLTGLNSVASKYQAINALRDLAAQDKDTFSELQAAIAAMKKK